MILMGGVTVGEPCGNLTSLSHDNVTRPRRRQNVAPSCDKVMFSHIITGAGPSLKAAAPVRVGQPGSRCVQVLTPETEADVTALAQTQRNL